MARTTPNLKALLRERHLQTYETFKQAYTRAQLALDPQDTQDRSPSRAQFHRWLSGDVDLPHARHCRVLESMFPGWTAARLFAPCDADGLAAVVPISAAPRATHAEDAGGTVRQLMHRLDSASGVVTGVRARTDELHTRLVEAWAQRQTAPRPTVVLVAGFAGCGKSEFAGLLSTITGWPVIDKDTMSRPLVEALLGAMGCDPHDRDSDAYLSEVRPLEYHCLITTALEQIERGISCIVTAPFIREVSDEHWMQRTANKCAALGVDLVVVWVECDAESMHEYLVRRGAARDAWKLSHWAEYLERVDQAMRPACDHFTIDNRLNAAASIIEQARRLAARVS